MKNYYSKSGVIIFLCLFSLAACYKRHFFEDASDPGLSRFTSRGYNVTSAYINSAPWVTSFSSLNGPSHVHVFRYPSSGTRDTLRISWNGEFSDSTVFPSASWRSWEYLVISIPVKKNFSKSDFLNWNGKLFPADSSTVTVSLSKYDLLTPQSSISGLGKIYFVKVMHGGADNEFNFSGLFEGKIGDSVLITKGRFDYQILSTEHNLQ